MKGFQCRWIWNWHPKIFLAHPWIPHHLKLKQFFSKHSIKKIKYQIVNWGIKSRWELCQQHEKKTQSHHQNHTRSKALVCNRALFVDRPNSRMADCGVRSGKESSLSVTEGMDDEDFDSISIASGIYTPVSTIAPADQTKIDVLEKQLAALQV